MRETCGLCVPDVGGGTHGSGDGPLEELNGIGFPQERSRSRSIASTRATHWCEVVGRHLREAQRQVVEKEPLSKHARKSFQMTVAQEMAEAFVEVIAKASWRLSSCLWEPHGGDTGAVY